MRNSILQPRSHRLRGYTAILAVAVAIHAWCCAPACAEGTTPIPFARYAPQSANVFLTTAKLGNLDAALTRAHAWELLPILVGVPVKEAKQHRLTEVVRGFLGVPSTVPVSELAELPLALVAPSKYELEKIVWLLRLPDPGVLDRWYPPPSRIGAGTDGAAKFFLTSSGALVCTRGDLVAVAREWGTGSMLQQTMALMAGRIQEHSLDRLDVYRSLRAHLPDGSIATLYLKSQVSADQPPGISSSVWPQVDRAFIGLYEGEGRLDVAIRARLASPHPMTRLSPRAVDRLMRLPQTTLFASALTIESQGRRDGKPASQPEGTFERYYSLLRALQSTDASLDATKKSDVFGPHLVVAWDQDAREDSQTPQVAVMIQCGDEQAGRDRASAVAARIIQLIGWLEPATDITPLHMETVPHLGTPIHYLPMKQYAEASKLAFVKLLANLNPAWTVAGDWLIVALDRSHIERILDAQFGLLPTLASVRDMQPVRQQSANLAALSLLQADLVTQVLNHWVEAAERGEPSLLDANWWARATGGFAADDAPFGIESKATHTNGVVSVTRASTGSPAVGRLQPGDRILGVDGHLLALNDARVDLRRKLYGSNVEPGPTVRVERAGALIDVTLPRGAEEKREVNLRSNPADAVRELATLGTTLRFSTLIVNAGDPSHYSARLSLRFRPSTAETNADH